MECTTNYDSLSNHLQLLKAPFKTPQAPGRFSLTRAQLPLEADAGEVITLTVLARDLAKITVVTHTLAADAFAALVAGGLPLTGAAVVLLGRTVLLLGALTVGSQPAWMAAAHATFEGAIAIVTAVAVRQGMLLATTITIEVHQHRQAVLEAHWLDGKRLLLFLGATTCLGLNAEAYLGSGTQAETLIMYAKETHSTNPQFCSERERERKRRRVPTPYKSLRELFLLKSGK